MKPSRSHRLLSALCFLLLLAAGPMPAQPRHGLRVSGAVAGPTPEVLGYTLGHLFMDSNSPDWFRYAEVNGFRVWSSVGTIEPEDDTSPWGDGVASREGFLARRTALRADPLNPEFINWPSFDKGYTGITTSASRLNIKDVMDFAAGHSLTPLIMIHRGIGSYPFRDSGNRPDWEARWETWQHFYAQAFWLGRHYGVERFQVYNEPDHSSNLRLSQSEYIERLKLSSDAVQCALEDVNRLYGSTLVPRITAPVTTSGTTKFHGRNDPARTDQRDAAKGWGELAMEEIRKPWLPGEWGGDFTNFQVYAYQQYGRNGPGFAEQYREIRRLVAAANGGQPLPVYITEFNVLANYMFRETPDTMHTPRRAARLGSILVNLVNERPDDLYVFKFGQTEYEGGKYLAKNGTYWQDNQTAPFATGGSTRGAEVYRLVMRAFQKGRELLAAPEWLEQAPRDVWSGASHDPATGLYHLFVVSEQAEQETKLDIDLSGWGLALPSLAILEEVSVARHGTVRALVQVPADGRLKLDLSPEAAWLITIPRDPFTFSLLPAAADAHVQGGDGKDRNFGNAPVLRVAGHSGKPDKRAAAYLEFQTGDLPVGKARRILLRLALRSTAANEVLPAHVYGLAGADWSEGAITAANAPFLSLDGGSMRAISDNRVSGQGKSTFILGTVTATDAVQDQFVDVTQFVRAHPQAPAFLVTQEVRFADELRYEGEMQIASRESGGAAPQLIFLF